jgi:hypothetical protein
MYLHNRVQHDGETVNGSNECGAKGTGYCLISILSHQPLIIATETATY